MEMSDFYVSESRGKNLWDETWGTFKLPIVYKLMFVVVVSS